MMISNYILNFILYIKYNKLFIITYLEIYNNLFIITYVVEKCLKIILDQQFISLFMPVPLSIC